MFKKPAEYALDFLVIYDFDKEAAIQAVINTQDEYIVTKGYILDVIQAVLNSVETRENA